MRDLTTPRKREAQQNWTTACFCITILQVPLRITSILLTQKLLDSVTAFLRQVSVCGGDSKDGAYI